MTNLDHTLSARRTGRSTLSELLARSGGDGAPPTTGAGVPSAFDLLLDQHRSLDTRRPERAQAPAMTPARPEARRSAGELLEAHRPSVDRSDGPDDRARSERRDPVRPADRAVRRPGQDDDDVRSVDDEVVADDTGADDFATSDETTTDDIGTDDTATDDIATDHTETSVDPTAAALAAAMLVVEPPTTAAVVVDDAAVLAVGAVDSPPDETAIADDETLDADMPADLRAADVGEAADERDTAAMSAEPVSSALSAVAPEATPPGVGELAGSDDAAELTVDPLDPVEEADVEVDETGSEPAADAPGEPPVAGAAQHDEPSNDASGASPHGDALPEPIVVVDAAPVIDAATPDATTPSPDGSRIDGVGGIQQQRSAPAPAAAAAVTAPQAAEFDGEVWEQVQKAVNLVRQSGPGRHEVSLVLRPEELGSVAVELVQRGDEVTVRIITQTAAAQGRLDRARLLTELQSAGIDPSSVDISHRDAGRSGQGSGDGNGRPSTSALLGVDDDGPTVERSTRSSRRVGSTAGGGVDLQL